MSGGWRVSSGRLVEKKQTPNGYRAKMDPARTLPRSCGPSASLANMAPRVTALAFLLFSAASSAAICALLHSSLQNAVSPLFDGTHHAWLVRAPFRK
jgi:hypothetical protein